MQFGILLGKKCVFNKLLLNQVKKWGGIKRLIGHRRSEGVSMAILNDREFVLNMFNEHYPEVLLACHSRSLPPNKYFILQDLIRQI